MPSKSMQQEAESMFELFIVYSSTDVINLNDLNANSKKSYYTIYDVQICTILRFHLGN